MLDVALGTCELTNIVNINRFALIYLTLIAQAFAVVGIGNLSTKWY